MVKKIRYRTFKNWPFKEEFSAETDPQEYISKISYPINMQ